MRAGRPTSRRDHPPAADRCELPSLERWLRGRPDREGGERLALIGIGVDQFREVNAALGRRGADGLLSDIARRLQAAAAAGEAGTGTPVITQVAGPTFAAVVVDPPEDRASAELAETLLSRFDEPFATALGPLWLTASAGVVRHHGPLDVDHLTGQIDAAVAAAARCRRNAVLLFDPAVHRAPAEHLRRRSELRTAIGTDRLVLRYQPVLCLEHTRVQGVEVLVGWHHPELGLLQPAQFLSLLDGAPLAVELSTLALDAALEQYRGWRDRDLIDDDVYVAIDLGADGLAATGRPFDAIVAERLEHHRVDPGALMVELTETTVHDQRDATTRGAAALRALGVRLAIGHLGASTSLERLLAWPADTLKLDRTLTERVTGDRVATAVVAGMVTIAQSLGLGLVAEGVATAPTAEALRELAVPSGQGHLWSPPLSAADVCTWLREYRHVVAAPRP